MYMETGSNVDIGINNTSTRLQKMRYQPEGGLPPYKTSYSNPFKGGIAPRTVCPWRKAFKGALPPA